MPTIRMRSITKDNSHESWAENAAQDNYDKYGLAAEIRYVGPRSDRGGALGEIMRRQRKQYALLAQL